jgi:hypothetical protein
VRVCVCVCVCGWMCVCSHCEIQIDCLAETGSNQKQWGGSGDVQRESTRASQAMAGAINDEVTIMSDAGSG